MSGYIEIMEAMNEILSYCIERQECLSRGRSAAEERIYVPSVAWAIAAIAWAIAIYLIERERQRVQVEVARLELEGKKQRTSN